MDMEQEELQFLGFFGIWGESFKIISSWRSIFLRLSLALILPLSFVYLAHSEISYLLMQNIMLDQFKLLDTMSLDQASYDAALRTLSREWAKYALFQVSFVICILIFSLLSTSAIVYTVACIFTGKEVTCKRVISIVPKVWKRLMVTLLCNLFVLSIYNFVFIFLAVITFLFFPINPHDMGTSIALGSTLLLSYIIGFCYMSVIWQLANVVSVLEESYGFQALRKSKILMKGKMGISLAIFLVNSLFLVGSLKLFKGFVVEVDRSTLGLFGRVGFGLISLVLVCGFLLLGLVVHTMFYLVCKSYHHEQIDKNALADHLEVFHGEGYVLLKSKSIQMEQAV